MGLAELSLQRIATGLPQFPGADLPAQLAAGRIEAEAALRKYVPGFAFDLGQAEAVTKRIDAWAMRNEQSLADAMQSAGGDLPAALQLAMGSSTEVGQFLIASFTRAAAGLGPWQSGAVAGAVAAGEHARGWAELDAETRLQTFGLIVRMERDGDLGPIFQPAATSGLGGWPVVAIIVATVIFAAAVVTYVYLDRRLELNNRLMRDLCERAQREGDHRTVEECVKATRDLQVSVAEAVGEKLLYGALLLGAGYLAIRYGPGLLSRATRRRAYAANARVPVLTPAQSRRRVAALRRRGCEVWEQERDGHVVVLKRCP